jgi:hypothetical protein
MDNMTLSDIAAVMPKNTTDHDGFLEGNGIIILILFFLIFGFGGWGNNGNGNLSADMQRGFDTQAVISKLDGLSSGLCDTAYENARLIEQNTVTNMQGFNQTQMGMMQGFNGVDKSLCQGFGNVQDSINNLSHQMEQCCCNLKTQMMQDKYETLNRDYQQALSAISNAAQTQNILNSLGRYVTNPPCPAGYGNFYGYPGATLQ